MKMPDEMEKQLHDAFVDAHNIMYMQIIREYQTGVSRWETISRLMALGMSLDDAREDLNLREGENGNDNGC
jgi:hypothetical protein